MKAKQLTYLSAGLLLTVALQSVQAHLIGDASHDRVAPKYDFSVKPPLGIALRNHDDARRVILLASANPSQPLLAAAGTATGAAGSFSELAARVASIFAPFAPKVKTRADDKFVYVESDSMPAHVMMVGITAWQQQVPIPQPYSGDNAWRIPLHPVVAKEPMSAKSHFFKGAIALAANGVPIFNPIKTDGRTDTFLAGELDNFGGHCGRADDYHYHIAPVHLQPVIGAGKPVAYALDGYAIYGYAEPDGSPAGKLDAFNGHETSALGYHYHATKTYPYLNGGFHGEVVERGGQVDPQPRTGGVRPALPPLRGAKIIGFTSRENKSFSVKYQVGSETRYVNYALTDNGTAKFDFVDGAGQVKTETYSPRTRGGAGGGDRPPGGGDRKKGDGKGKGGERKGGPRPEGNRDGGRPSDRAEARPTGNQTAPAAAPLIIKPKHSGNFVLTSPAIKDGDPLPDEFNGNGEGATLPLAWKGAPAGTQSYALVMDHIDRDGVLKTYWTMYDIPPTVTSLPKNVKGVGKLGATWKRDSTYVTPHSAGGAKQTYTLHVYALSAAPKFPNVQGLVTREMLLTTIVDTILDSAELNVTYTRPRDEAARGKSKGGGNGGKRGEPGTAPRPKQ